MPRKNLISVHSTLGHCTGNLQGLRHECQGLVNWYQSMPNMEITKRKLLSCQEEMKGSESDRFVHYHQVEEQKDLIQKLTEEVIVQQTLGLDLYLLYYRESLVLITRIIQKTRKMKLKKMNNPSLLMKTPALDQ